MYLVCILALSKKKRIPIGKFFESVIKIYIMHSISPSIYKPKYIYKPFMVSNSIIIQFNIKSPNIHKSMQLMINEHKIEYCHAFIWLICKHRTLQYGQQDYSLAN